MSFGVHQRTSNSPSGTNHDDKGCLCDPAQLSVHVKTLRNEVTKLRTRLQLAEKEHNEKMALLEREEREQREQNIRLQRKLQLEIERREKLCRNLSESESSLEIDFDDRQTSQGSEQNVSTSIHCNSSMSSNGRQRTLSSPVPMNVAMSPPAKAPPPTPLAISSPISHEYLMPRPISPISRHKTVCCPKCGHSFLASIGSYTNLFANSNIQSHHQHHQLNQNQCNSSLPQTLGNHQQSLIQTAASIENVSRVSIGPTEKQIADNIQMDSD
ncbi:exosome complex component RRP4 [Sarcoptes scabiei]|nr:exosome complex component RRP4 [Sarcoptes scabiei]